MLREDVTEQRALAHLASTGDECHSKVGCQESKPVFGVSAEIIHREFHSSLAN
jgi:hypothetical protein